jgi:hypothetical protein
MRIAINTGCLALIRPQLCAGGLVFRISVSKCRLHAAWAAIAGIWPANCARRERSASTFQRNRRQCVD